LYEREVIARVQLCHNLASSVGADAAYHWLLHRCFASAAVAAAAAAAAVGCEFLSTPSSDFKFRS